MEVTHVMRGEDHISNTPRQVLLYEALGFTPPVFAHLALVMGPDHSPLSKRHGATSVAEFRAKGYLPEALVNYLALIGWSPRGAGAARQRRRGAAADRRARAPLLARARRAQRRRVRRGEAGVGESPLPEDGGSGPPRGALGAVLHRRRRADGARRARPGVSRRRRWRWRPRRSIGSIRCRRGWRCSSTTRRRRRSPTRSVRREMRADGAQSVVRALAEELATRAAARSRALPRRGERGEGADRTEGEGALSSDSRRADRTRGRAGARSRDPGDRSRRRAAGGCRDPEDPRLPRARGGVRRALLDR